MRRKIPTTAALVAFELAARYESFTRAAEQLSLTQSAICRQIAGLEDFLGVPLFRRTRRGVQLTEAGRNYSRQVAMRLDAVERDTLSLMAHHGSGATIELAVVPTFATRWLLPRLPAFRKLHPEVTVNLTNRTRAFLFAETEFDAALHFGEAGWPGTEAHFLMHEDPVPVCSAALLAGRTRLSAEEVAALPLLQQTTRPYAWRQWFDAGGLHVEHDMTGARLELFSMLAEAAAHHMGVALIPPFLIREELASGRLVIANDRALRIDKAYYLIIPERKAETRALTAFRDWLLAEAAAYRAQQHAGEAAAA